MVCRSNAISGTDQVNRPWANWAGTATAIIPRYFEPGSLPELVEIVAQATEANRELHALGSGWAFEDLSLAEWVVQLGQLQSELPYVIARALTPEWAARQADPASDVRLFHVEAGADIGLVNEMLAASGLAMISLGGANGQSLAGAISTSTHGGDVRLPPLPGLVRAIHLVAEGGREIWLERASEAITTDAGLRGALPCPDTQVVRDDRMFDAVLVGAGRFGVIYSVVIVVRPAYFLAEWTVERDGVQVLADLLSGIEAGTGLTPLLESLPAPPNGLGAIQGDEPGSARFLQVLFNSQDPRQCFVTRRWETDNHDELNLDLVEPFPCNPGEPQAVLGIAAAALDAASIGLSLIPFVGPFWATEAVVAARRLNALMGEAGLTGGRAVAVSLNAAWDNHLGDLTPVISRQVLGGRFADSAAAGRRGRSDIVMTGTRVSNRSECFRVNSAEVVFPATDDRYVRFLQEILPISLAFRQSGIVSLRYSAPERALLSMHHHDADMVVSIETASLRGLRDTDSWLNMVQGSALAHDGRMHWGQRNKLSEGDVATSYASDLLQWQEALLAISGASATFSNRFTRERGLEPRGILRQVVRTRKVRRGGGRTVTHLCGSEQSGWGPVSVVDAIEQIEAGTVVYFTEAGGFASRVVVRTNASGKYLRTEGDRSRVNNLDELPDC